MNQNEPLQLLNTWIEENGFRVVKKALMYADNYCLLRFEWNKNTFEVLADNEYRDAESENPALLLILVLFALDDCSCPYDEWLFDLALTDDNQLRTIYENSRAALKTMHQFADQNPVSRFDFELNAGAVQMLRKQQ